MKKSIAAILACVCGLAFADSYKTIRHAQITPTNRVVLSIPTWAQGDTPPESGVNTNTVNDLIRAYDTTNLTARINAKQNKIADYTTTNAVIDITSSAAVTNAGAVAASVPNSHNGNYIQWDDESNINIMANRVFGDAGTSFVSEGGDFTITENGEVSHKLSLKANAADVYTKTQINGTSVTNLGAVVAATNAVPTVTSNVVTKAYVEGLGIEAGISANTSTNIARAVSSDIVRNALWTNEVNQLWRDLALEVKTYAHDPVNDKYYKLYADATGGDVTAAIDTNGVDYADIADPYWRRYATNYLGDVTAFVVSVTNGQEFALNVEHRNKHIPTIIDWGDGTSTNMSISSLNRQPVYHVYEKGGEYIVSVDGSYGFNVGNANDMPRYNAYSPAVIRVLSFESFMDNMFTMFRWCKNAKGYLPPLPESALVMASSFASCKFKNIQKWPISILQCQYSYSSCTLAEDVPSENADVLMPEQASVFLSCVLGCQWRIRKHFFTSWGGSNGWTGEYYTSANAPVPSLVGERIYEPIGNVNSFEIKLAPNDYSNNVFTFEMRVQSFADRNIRVDWGDGTLTTYPSNTFASAVTLITHDYTKPSGNATNRYCVCVDSGATRFAIARNNSHYIGHTPSHIVVRRILSYSDSVKSVVEAYYGCKNAIGTFPEWGMSITDVSFAYVGCYYNEGQIPQWTDKIKNANSCYYTVIEDRMSGNIPRWKYNGSMDVRRVYRGRTNITPWESASYEELMPTNYIHGAFDGEYPVSHATLLMPHFYQSWGGTIPDPE